MTDRQTPATELAVSDKDVRDSPSDDSAAKEPSITESVWISSSMSGLREVLFVAIVCMAQFCTRKCYATLAA